MPSVGLTSFTNSRESLIYALNEALRETELPSNALTTSRFDAGTGTLYCEDSKEVFSHAKITEAISFFENAQRAYRSKDTLEDFKKSEYCDRPYCNSNHVARGEIENFERIRKPIWECSFSNVMNA